MTGNVQHWKLFRSKPLIKLNKNEDQYSTIAMSRNKYLSFRTAEGVWKTLFKANVTVLLLILRNNVTISRLYRICRQ